MTFSIIARCPATGQFGIAVSSSSMAVGARCAWAQAGQGVVASQNVTLPALGPQILTALADPDMTPQRALTQALDGDAGHAWRQVTVVDRHGATAVHSGEHTLGIYHAVQGAACVAAGNMLRDKNVIDAMVNTFTASSATLPERLLAAMKAGMAAGGEAGPVHSAALKVVDKVSWPVIDLRVDWTDGDPIAELDGLLQAWLPQMQDYIVRALNPMAAPGYGVPGDE